MWRGKEEGIRDELAWFEMEEIKHIEESMKLMTSVNNKRSWLLCTEVITMFTSEKGFMSTDVWLMISSQGLLIKPSMTKWNKDGV
jgi:hypothetical protein